MKNFIIVLLILILIVASVLLYSSAHLKNIYSEYFGDILNGEEIDSLDDEVIKRWTKEYRDKYLFSNDAAFCVLDNIDNFNIFLSGMSEVKQILESDPFTVIENVIDVSSIPYYYTYARYYSMDNKEYDSRVFDNNNQLFIKYSDISFDGSYDVVKYGSFVRYISKDEIDKETCSQRKTAHPYVYVGEVDEDGLWVYKYFDTINNKTVSIKVDKVIWGVKSCVLTES